jgi:hypothetical protein
MYYLIQRYGDGEIRREGNKYRLFTNGKSSKDYASVAELVKDNPLNGEGETVDGYEAMTVDELKAEINRRNEGREEADQLSTAGKKADLIATLEADDSREG